MELILNHLKLAIRLPESIPSLGIQYEEIIRMMVLVGDD